MKKFSIDILSEKCFGLGTYPCNETPNDDGRIYLPYGTGEGEGPCALFSDDNGMTFEKKEDSDHPTVCFKKLNDGTFLGLGFSSPTMKTLYNKDYGDIPFCLCVYRAASYDDILAGKVSTSYEILDIPDLTWGYGDSKNVGLGCPTGWRQLSNGDILVTMYGHTKNDTVLCPWFQEWGPYDFYLYSTWCFVSHDGGKSFEYLSPIADCQNFPIADINAEGYCEADIVEVENGHVLCILRTGGHNIKSPLYACHSYDYGKTWEAPYEISEWGVFPRVLKMQSGRIVIATGHPDVFLLVSDDGGKTWSDMVMVQDDPGDWGETTSGYHAIFEPEKDVLSLIYDASFEAKVERKGENLLRYVYHRTFKLVEE